MSSLKVSEVLLVILSMKPQLEFHLDPQDHVVSQDLWDPQAMVVPQVFQDVKARESTINK